MSSGKITLTKEELITIIEDAFIDGWNQHTYDWSGAEAYLRHHKDYGDCCETTIALDDIRTGAL